MEKMNAGNSGDVSMFMVYALAEPDLAEIERLPGTAASEGYPDGLSLVASKAGELVVSDAKFPFRNEILKAVIRVAAVLP